MSRFARKPDTEIIIENDKDKRVAPATIIPLFKTPSRARVRATCAFKARIR